MFQATLTGYVGKDPKEIVSKDDGRPIGLRFNMAVSTYRKSESVTTWVQVTAWARSQAQMDYLKDRIKKGNFVVVTVRDFPQLYTWTGQDGTINITQQYNAFNVEGVTRGRSANDNGEGSGGDEENDNAQETIMQDDIDDLPQPEDEIPF